jgi:hypothetical protein
VARGELIALRHAGRTCVVFHFLAWCIAAATWTLKWVREGPAPYGRLYNSAYLFIGRVDILVRETARRLAVYIGQSGFDWLAGQYGAWLTISFAFLILIGGTLQWFLLGRLVQWIADHKHQRFARMLLGFYVAWAAGAVLLWIAERA